VIKEYIKIKEEPKRKKLLALRKYSLKQQLKLLNEK